jgi:hypothetical protein
MLRQRSSAQDSRAPFCPSDQTLHGMMSQDWRAPRRRSKRLSFCLSSFLTCSLASARRGAGSCSTALQELASPTLRRQLRQRRRARSSPSRVRTSSASGRATPSGRRHVGPTFGGL